MITQSRRAFFNIRDFGAVGDGVQKDSPAIQQTIDACAAAGGGVVYCPPGAYLCGTITLKSHINLNLEAGATLLGSPDPSDYIALYPDPSWINRFNFDQHMIRARGAQNVSISGRGVIDGNGRAYFGPMRPGGHKLSVGDWRPGPMVTFIECQDISVRDVRLHDSPAFSLWAVGCDRADVSGLTILNQRDGPNCDGIQIVCCHGVRISDCYISAGDDCIAVYSMSYFLAEPRACENVVAANCILSTPCNGVRVGYTGDWPVRNCAFSNMIMFNTRTGISMVCTPHNAWKTAREHVSHRGPITENISFDHIQMEARKPIDLWIDENAKPPAGIRNVRISHVTASATRGCYIGGNRKIPIENLHISDLHLTMSGEMPAHVGPDVADPYPQYDWNEAGLPHGLFARHVRGLSLRDVRIEWESVTGPWQSALRVEEASDLELSGVSAIAAPGPAAAPALHLIDIDGATARGCRALPGTGTFLRLQGARTAHVVALANDLSRAEQPFDLADETPAGALCEMGNLLCST
jgi:hypothetical protein